MKSTKEILKAARSLISKRKNWCVGNIHQVTSTGDTQRCARGAILKAISPKSIHSVSERKEIPIAKALLAGMIGPKKAALVDDPVGMVCGWNNSHRHKQVLSALDKAIKAL